MKILGISAFYHDSAAALVVDGKKKSQEMETGKNFHDFFSRQVLAQCNVRTLSSSWIWIRSASQMKDPNRWWPPQIPAPRWREAGQVALATDRGAEKLLLLCQKRDN